ncbi:MAG: glycosyltransferase 87 family protein, partial [Bdellovibrionales bacterium]
MGVPKKKKNKNKNASGLPPIDLRLALDYMIYALLALLAAYLIFFIFPVLHARLFYSGPLEHQEEIFLNILRWMREGKNIYQVPDLNFAGAIYPPFYFFVADIFVNFMGLSFFSLRLLSLISIIGMAGCVYAMLRPYVPSRWLCLAWLPLYFSMWPLYGWMDIGRLEAVFLFLICAGAACVLRANNRPWVLFLGGCLLGLAAATKQTAIVLLALAFIAVVFDRNYLPVLSGMLLAAAAAYGAGYVLFGPSMFVWVFEVVARHGHDYEVGFNLIFYSLRNCSGIAVLLLLFLFALIYTERRKAFALLFVAVLALLS